MSFDILLIIILLVLSFMLVQCAPIIEKLPDGYFIIHYTIPFTGNRSYFRFKI